MHFLRNTLFYPIDRPKPCGSEGIPLLVANTSEMSGGILPFLMAEAFKFAISWWQFQWFFRPFWVYLQTYRTCHRQLPTDA
jgi:hypothetical protein